MPPPPPPPRQGWRNRMKSTTQQFKARLAGHKWHVAGAIAIALVAIMVVGGGIMAAMGWMNRPNSDGEIAAAARGRDVPPPSADVPDPNDPGESDVVVDDTEAAPVAAADEVAATDDEADAAVVVAAVEPPTALPPPTLSAGPTEPPAVESAAEPAVVATADTSPCGTPDGLTDEGHLRCLDHALGLARALTPDWHPTAAP